jgi:branched-chain amino acid transport system permease protein
MRNWVILAVGVLLVASLMLVGGNYSLRLGTTFAMYAVLALSWNFIGGLAGYPSFATAAFFGLGAYASGICPCRSHGRPAGSSLRCLPA